MGDDDGPAVRLLTTYFGPSFAARDSFTGAAFDCWDSTGTRAADVDRFTADDLIAVSLLSIRIKPRWAHEVLHARAPDLSSLLAAMRPDRDLATEAARIGPDWPGCRLYDALISIPGVGAVTASKLMARKRPLLIPVWDSVVADVTNTRQQQWERLRVALREGDPSLHVRLGAIREAAGLNPQVSPLRVLDVIAWMEGIGRTA
jgi:hypothetical protein